VRDEVSFPVLPDLTSIDFSRTADIRELARERRDHLFGPPDEEYIDDFMDAIDELFAGRHSDYQAVDTRYHDIAHTLQATLCLVELLHNRHFSAATPRIGPDDFRRALIAALFHDVGYLKRRDDVEGTGAKYTHVHEMRSCEFIRDYLPHWDWPPGEVRAVANMISATGPRADVTRIDFQSETERALGQAVCTADYIGQMSDPGYPDKLEVLFAEFEESYRYQGLPQSEWPIPSYQAMLGGTPDFWSGFVQRKLNVECAGIYSYLRHPRTQQNPYLESIEGNIAVIEQKIARVGPVERAV
jgi:hypothetical protein